MEKQCSLFGNSLASQVFFDLAGVLPLLFNLSPHLYQACLETALARLSLEISYAGQLREMRTIEDEKETQDEGML